MFGVDAPVECNMDSQANRRKTMSGLHGSSGLNARRMQQGNGKSDVMGPPPCKMESVQRGMSRMSLAGPVQRRSSAYTTVKAPPGVKGDPRPVGDKGYQAACARNVMQFLTSNGYEYQVTMKTLTSPTTKEYTNIMLFIARFVDANILKGFTKLEEEVPQLYKRLKYPFTISKSNLTAVGSPHTWPSILASLSWIVELLNYNKKAGEVRMDVADEKAKMEADFFEYVSTSYQHFMAGEDERCEAIDNAKGAEIEEKAVKVKDEVEKLDAANASLREKIEALKIAPRPLKEAQERLCETQQDKEKFVKLVENLQTHHSSLLRKMAEKRADISSQERQLEVIEEECESLRKKIAAQTVHPADVIRMNQEKAKYEAALASLSQQKDEADVQSDETLKKLNDKFEDIEEKMAEYMMRAHKLQLIPATAKRAEGFVFEARLDRSATTGSSMVPLDFKGIVKPVLQQIRDVYSSKARYLGKEELSLEEKCDALREITAERAGENASLEAQVKDLEAQYRKNKEELEADVATALSHVQNLADEVASIRGACAAGVAESEERLRTAHAELEELQHACALESSTLHRDLAVALEIILNHKMAIRAKIDRAEERVMTCLEDVESFQCPTTVE